MLRVPSSISASHFQSLKIQEMMFVAYRSDVYPDRNEVFFEENAVIVVLEGEKRFKSPTQDLHVKKGDILFFQRGCYSMNENLDVHYKSLVFFFHEKQIKEFVNQNFALFEQKKEIERSPILKLKTNDKFDRFIDSLLPYFHSETPYLNQFLRLKFQELLLHLLEMDGSKQLHSILKDINLGFKTDLAFLINEYYLKPLSINELAKISGRSLSSFKRDFEQQFSISPAAFIKQKRLEHAHLLLKNSSKNVSEISLEVGYESVSHFIKAFKEKYGFTPKFSM
jgi:AraC family transcriptional regulator, exoenzyme S synthesis regulatory protein ExsA